MTEYYKYILMRFEEHADVLHLVARGMMINAGLDKPNMEHDEECFQDAKKYLDIVARDITRITKRRNRLEIP